MRIPAMFGCFSICRCHSVCYDGSILHQSAFAVITVCMGVLFRYWKSNEEKLKHGERNGHRRNVRKLA